jgi:hypothetical protein
MLFSISRFIGEVVFLVILFYLTVLSNFFRFIRKMISNLFILLFCSIALLGALFVLEHVCSSKLRRRPDWNERCHTCKFVNYLLEILQPKWLEFKFYIKNLDFKSIFNNKKNPADSSFKEEFIVDKEDLPLYFINSINEVNIMDSIYFFIFLFIVVIILLSIRMYLTRLLNKYGSFFVYYAPKWFKNNSSVLFNLLRWLKNHYIYSILIYLFYFMLFLFILNNI